MSILYYLCVYSMFVDLYWGWASFKCCFLWFFGTGIVSFSLPKNYFKSKFRTGKETHVLNIIILSIEQQQYRCKPSDILLETVAQMSIK